MRFEPGQWRGKTRKKAEEYAFVKITDKANF